MKILYITPHLSTGGAPQYLLKKIEFLNNEHDIHVIEYNDYGAYRVQKNKIIDKLKNKHYTLREDKNQLLQYLDDIKPDVVHFEEFPEFFCDDSISEKIYDKERKYKIFETSHDSSFDPKNKRFFPDKFLFCSDNQLVKFRSIDIPTCVIEYPVNQNVRPDRSIALRNLNLDPAKKHVLNVGLFTPRKNQAEIFEYAKQMTDVCFHFVGNQAENFKDYWHPLMENKPDNCYVWGERNDVDKFYSCMDLFLFASKDNHGDKETNPLVLKEAMSWNIPIMAHKIDSYMDKYDDKITWLSSDNICNIIRIYRLLGLSDKILNCWNEDLKFNFQIHQYQEYFQDKLLCLYEIDTDLLVYRTKLSDGMWMQPNTSKQVVNGFIVRIYNAPHDYYSNLAKVDFTSDSHILFEKKFPMKKEVVLDQKYHGIKDDASAWYTLFETLIRKFYQDMNISKGDTIIDIGGHYGFFGKFALDEGASLVHTIEPTKSTYDVLCKNLGKYRNVIKHNFAISDKEEYKTFKHLGPSATCTFYDEDNWNASKDNQNSNGLIVEEKVRCMSFNQFLKNNDLSRIDALKIDCEGAEWDILPTISDDFYRYKMRKLCMESHDFAPNAKENVTNFIEKLKSLNYQVKSDSEVLEGKTGNMWAIRNPKIKVVHMLVDAEGEREKKSIHHLKKLCEYARWEYKQEINELYTDLPPSKTCARPDDIQLEPGSYKLSPAHYGNYLAHVNAISNNLYPEYDGVLFCECDAIFVRPMHEVHRQIMNSLDDLDYHDMYFMSFGKRIPDWHYVEYDSFGITTRMSEAHCYLLSCRQDSRTYYNEKTSSSKWDTFDLWLNDNIFNDVKSGIVKKPLSIQCSGNSYLDKSFKDGTTLINNEDMISYEEF